ncbi:hypothetical protein [Ralstonia mannitolilytica]|uniref:hypothetical protein n=1 Tax=Ralstonia mannitolilytica TaxID=105219 RepID=UPI0014255C8D|nr:hypothetical protein [Ralstonia mannitolilytica]
MDRLERLQALIVASRKRWTEKYGWVKPEDCREPTWQEEMDADAERAMFREYRVFMRQHLADIAEKESASADSAPEDGDADEGQRNSRPT